MPPLPCDDQFRVGHDAKRLYYIGKLDGVKKLVIVFLKDLTHQFLDLGPDAKLIDNLKDSSLFQNYLCYQIREKVEMR